jgi:hypothetical protein
MTGKKIKIALCLSGEPRSSMFCFPYIYESFINLGPQYEVDVYIHSWENFRALPLYNPLATKIEKNKSIEIVNSLPSPYNTTQYQNHSLMYYSIKESFKLIKKVYDIYIRCRLDLIFESKLVLNPIFEDTLKNYHDIFSLHSSYPTKHEGGVDDQVMICNEKGMLSLINYYDYIKNTPKELFEEQTKKFKGFYGEGFLQNYLNKLNLKIINNPLSDYRLVRNSQVVTDEPFNFLDQ